LMSVELQIEDLGDLELGFTVNFDGRWLSGSVLLDDLTRRSRNAGD